MTMKEKIVVDVAEGSALQLAGRTITVPAGVKSVTIVVRDTESFEAARKKREALRAKRQGKGGGAGKRAGRAARRGRAGA